MQPQSQIVGKNTKGHYNMYKTYLISSDVHCSKHIIVKYS